MSGIVLKIGRFFEELRPASDSQAACASEVSHRETRARQKLKMEYSRLFEADLEQASVQASLAQSR